MEKISITPFPLYKTKPTGATRYCFPIKKLLVLCLLLCLGPAMNAQEGDIQAARQLPPEELPAVIRDAIKRDFPQSGVNRALTMPALLYRLDWQVTDEEPPVDSGYMYYALDLENGATLLEAVYDRDGKLMHVKTYNKNSRLPRRIPAYVVRSYKGYTIRPDMIKRIVLPETKKACYEIWITKGEDRKRLVFDSNGVFVKEM